MRRTGVGVERQPDGTWIMAPDHLDRVEAYGRGQARTKPVTVDILSAHPLKITIVALTQLYQALSKVDVLSGLLRGNTPAVRSPAHHPPFAPGLHLVERVA